MRLSDIRPICLALIILPALAFGRPPDGQGGGTLDAEAFADEMPPAVRQSIETELAEAARRLRAEGRLAPARGALTPGSLGWPLQARAGFEFDDYHGVSNFVDLDSNAPGALLDYMCNERTYDLENGYNHAGVDYFLWPYAWRMMDQEAIEIVAIAPGTILAKHDGNDDRNCAFGTDPWNAVYVQHADGSVAWYGHMLKDSLTDKAPGDTVAQGEFLGLVGSSGSSTGPHLHLELRASNQPGAAIYEPHEGACNDTITASLWEDERPYYDTALNGVGVHDAQPSMAVDCPDPGQEAASLTDQVGLGEPVWFTVYFRDVVPGQGTLTLRLYRPDDAIYHEWTFDYPGSDHYPGAWYFWSWNSLGTHEAFEGEWRFEAEFGDQTVSRSFFHGEPPVDIFADRFEP